MQVKIFTTNDAVEAEAMRVDMQETGFEVIICNKAEMVTVICANLVNGCTASDIDSWVVIGKIDN